MAENKKEKRIEKLKMELKIRKGIAKANRGFCREIKKEIEALENAET